MLFSGHCSICDVKQIHCT